MITEETVFILGAGASAAYGYPTGKDLRDQIIIVFYPKYSTMVTNNPHYDRRQKAELNNKAKMYVDKFKSSRESIDYFL